MKYRYLFTDFKPQSKCGAETGAAIAVSSGLASLMGNIYSVDQQQGNVNRQLAAQAAENQKNRDWQTNQAEIARAWASQSQARQQGYTQQNMAQQQQYNLQSMAQQAQYNSPVYQRQQLQAAGINPQVYFGSQSSFGGSSAQSGPGPQGASAPSAPNVGSVQGLSPVSFQPEHLQLGALTSQIANNVKALAEAKKLGVETGWIDDRMKAEIRSLSTESDLKSVLKVGAELTNQLNKEALPYQIKMASKNLAKVVSEIELNEEGKITQQSIQKVNEAAAKWHDAQSKLTDKEVEKMGLEMPYYVNLLVSQINKNKGEAEEARSSARLLNANAVNQEFMNEITSKPEVRESFIKELRLAGEAAEKANDISKEQANLLRGQIAQLEKATSNYEIQMWSNIINQTINSAANALGEFTRFGLVKKFMNNKGDFDPNAGRGYMIQDGQLMFNPVR